MAINQNGIAHVKSTIDKWGKEIAGTALGVEATALDLDDRQQVQSLLSESSTNALAWKVMDFSSTERIGIHNLAFAMGSAIQDDVNNMTALSVAGAVEEFFCVGRTYPVNNFISTVAPFPEIGRFAIRTVDMNPQVSDSLTGYRLVVVEGFFFFAI